MKKYIVLVIMSESNQPSIEIEVNAENAELALNKVQGGLFVTDGWIRIDDRFGNQHRIKNEVINHLVVNLGMMEDNT